LLIDRNGFVVIDSTPTEQSSWNVSLRLTLEPAWPAWPRGERGHEHLGCHRGGKTFKRDYARLSILLDAETVIALLLAWFEVYNEVHPHSGLKFLSPGEFLRLRA